MSPVQWALQPLKKYATFAGRAPRAEFWWFFLFIVIVYVAMMVLFVGIGAGLGASAQSSGNPVAAFAAMGTLGVVVGVFWLAMIIPMIAVQVRRMHDLNRSGWWIGGFYLLYLVYMGAVLSAVASAAAQSGTAAEPQMATLGFSMILGLVMFIYSIVLLVFYCLPGTPGPNDYGLDPYGHDQNVGDVFA